MKKIYFSVFALCASLTLNAQQTIGFEGVILSPESFNDDSTATGGFIENGVVFSSDYILSQWGNYWTGFAVSNRTDVTTPGYANEYSAYAGIGADGSANYGIWNSNGVISFAGGGVGLVSVDVTNTTYAGLSMLNGDSFGKQFGSPNDASGNPDGTNGADFFKLNIYAYRENGSIIDSTNYYLADYRFSDNSQDYILNTWHTVDLSFITEKVYSVSFLLQSSDVGQWGMNTPDYFAIDNLVIDKSVGLPEMALNTITTFPNPMMNQLTIKGETGTVELFDVSGKVIRTQNHAYLTVMDVSDLTSGSYTLKVSNEKGTFVQKLVK